MLVRHIHRSRQCAGQACGQAGGWGRGETPAEQRDVPAGKADGPCPTPVQGRQEPTESPPVAKTTGNRKVRTLPEAVMLHVPTFSPAPSSPSCTSMSNETGRQSVSHCTSQVPRNDT